MSDEEFCKRVAALWVDLGGDDIGLDFVYRNLKNAIRDEQENRK